jgi:Holliday junction resolvase RusA-like endonuclease
VTKASPTQRALAERTWHAHVSINGPPIGKGRPRAFVVGGSRPGSPARVRAYTPEKTRSWERDAAWIMAEEWTSDAPYDGPVRVTVVAVAARPKRLMRKRDPDGTVWRCSKPDGDNVLKAVADAMVLARVIDDDVQIVDARVLSVYAAKGDGPRVDVLWTNELTEPDDVETEA